MTNTRWTVGNVHTSEEFETAAGLRRIGLEVWCPTINVLVRKWRRGFRPRRPEQVERPMLPGYLLIDESSIGNEEAVYGVDGFHYFLRFSETGFKKILQPADVDLLREMEGSQPTSLDAILTRIMVGNAVRVDGGAFGGMKGIVESVARGRAMVAGGDFGRYPTEFPAELLEAEG